MTRLYHEEAERALIASLMADPARIPEVGAKLQAEDFYSSVFRSAYSTMQSLSREGKRIDVVTLGAHGVKLPTGFLDVLGRLDDNTGDWVDLIQEAAFRRRIEDHGVRIQSIAASDRTHSEILGELQSFNQSLAEDIHDPRLYSSIRAAQDYQVTLERRKTQGSGVRWGYEDLDALLQPAMGGDMVVIAARPSVGKTTLAENLIDNWAFESEYPVLFVSIEMRLSLLMDRGISRNTGIAAQRLLRGDIGPSEEALVQTAIQNRPLYNIWYVDDGNATTSSIRAAASKVALSHGGLRAIVVDYIQIVKDPGDNDNQRVGKTSRSLKAIAREFDVPLLALSQLNRGSERERRRPRLSDLRDSGAIEQDADIVFGLHPENDDTLEVIVLKNRNGSLGTVFLGFDKGRTLIHDDTD